MHENRILVATRARPNTKQQTTNPDGAYLNGTGVAKRRFLSNEFRNERYLLLLLREHLLRNAIDPEELVGNGAVCKLELLPVLALGVAPQLVQPRLPDLFLVPPRQGAEPPFGARVVGDEDRVAPVGADEVCSASLFWVELPAGVAWDFLGLGWGCAEDRHLGWGSGLRHQGWGLALRFEGLRGSVLGFGDQGLGTRD